MNQGSETVHVAFGWPIAKSVRDALRLLGCHDRVIELSDNLSFGPIDPPDTNLRHAWTKAVLRYDLDDDLPDAAKAWAEATAPEIYPVFWVCMSSPPEQASFLEFASRMDGRGFDIVDATGIKFQIAAGVQAPWSLGLMRPADIISSNLYTKRRPVLPAELTAASRVWSQLRQENAPFRIVTDGRLVSAPLTYFDTFLIDHASREWEISARLIGRTITSMSLDMDPPGQAPGDIVLFGRMLALGENGSLEIEGWGPGMRDYKVRKPAVGHSVIQVSRG